LTGTLAETPTRDRIIDAAVKLFAERGYRRTTIGDIEAAAGLSPRSGALYKHFASKRDVLEAALDRHIRTLEAMTTAMDLMPLGDVRAEVTLLVRWGLQELRKQADLLLILQREAFEFPDLVASFHERLAKRAFRDAADWAKRALAEHGRPEADADALTVIVLGAIVHYQTECATYREPPGGVGEERFVRALADLCVRFVEGSNV
jgi:AcrR family transcriptional regulator